LHCLTRWPRAGHEVDQSICQRRWLCDHQLVALLGEQLTRRGRASPTPASFSVLDHGDRLHLGVPFAIDHEPVAHDHGILQVIRQPEVGVIDLTNLNSLDLAGQRGQPLDLLPGEFDRQIASSRAPVLKRGVDIAGAKGIEVALDDLDRVARRVPVLAVRLSRAVIA